VKTSAVVNPAEVFDFCYSCAELIGFDQEINDDDHDDVDIHWITVFTIWLPQSEWYNMCNSQLCFALYFCVWEGMAFTCNSFFITFLLIKFSCVKKKGK